MQSEIIDLVTGSEEENGDSDIIYLGQNMQSLLGIQVKETDYSDLPPELESPLREESSGEDSAPQAIDDPLVFIRYQREEVEKKRLKREKRREKKKKLRLMEKHTTADIASMVQMFENHSVSTGQPEGESQSLTNYNSIQSKYSALYIPKQSKHPREKKKKESEEFNFICDILDNGEILLADCEVLCPKCAALCQRFQNINSIYCEGCARYFCLLCHTFYKEKLLIKRHFMYSVCYSQGPVLVPYIYIYIYMNIERSTCNRDIR